MEHHLRVTKTARYHTLGTPSAEVRSLWIACHGYGQLAADFIAGLGALDSPATLVVAPEALSRYYVNDQGGMHGPDSMVGATWMTREDRLTDIEDYVAYLETLHAHVVEDLPSDPRPRLTVLGFSQGAATAARWAARTRAQIDELVLWGARLPPELSAGDLTRVGGSPSVTLVAGQRDRWATPAAAREEAGRLLEDGIEARVLTFEGGHRMDDQTLVRIANGE